MKKVLPFSTKVIIALLSLMTFINSANGQDKRQKNLENQRKQLQEEIKQINKLLFSNENRKKQFLQKLKI